MSTRTHRSRTDICISSKHLSGHGDRTPLASQPSTHPSIKIIINNHLFMNNTSNKSIEYTQVLEPFDISKYLQTIFQCIIPRTSCYSWQYSWHRQRVLIPKGMCGWRLDYLIDLKYLLGGYKNLLRTNIISILCQEYCAPIG